MFTHIQKKETRRKGKKSQENRSREVGTEEILEIEKSVQKSGVVKNASAKGLESCN